MNTPTVKRTLPFALLFFLIFACLAGTAQKKAKLSRIEFCGVKIYKKQFIIDSYQQQFDFIGLQENDTLVDIGAGSGWYEGAMSAALPHNNLTFYLVDIDSNCLNKAKVNNMITHYSNVRGQHITNNFNIVNNTVDSLWLPLNHFKKVCIFNTLHEIPAKAKMVKAMNNILQAGGEVYVLEMMPRKPHELHGGCHQPLMTTEELNTLFTKNGFTVKARVELLQNKRSLMQLIKYMKNN